MVPNQWTAGEIVMLLQEYARRFDKYAGTHTIGGAYKEHDQEFVGELEKQIEHLDGLVAALRVAVIGESRRPWLEDIEPRPYVGRKKTGGR